MPDLFGMKDGDEFVIDESK